MCCRSATCCGGRRGRHLKSQNNACCVLGVPGPVLHHVGYRRPGPGRRRDGTPACGSVIARPQFHPNHHRSRHAHTPELHILYIVCIARRHAGLIACPRAFVQFCSPGGRHGKGNARQGESQACTGQGGGCGIPSWRGFFLGAHRTEEAQAGTRRRGAVGCRRRTQPGVLPCLGLVLPVPPQRQSAAGCSRDSFIFLCRMLLLKLRRSSRASSQRRRPGRARCACVCVCWAGGEEGAGLGDDAVARPMACLACTAGRV